MAESFAEVVKEYKRMCNLSERCSNCPMNKSKDSAYTCRYWMLHVDPEAAEKVILDWAAEHPVKTNRKKFKEVFGIDFSDLYNSGFSRCIQNWLEKEYEEPKK